jgi:hypothetical protein
MAIIDLFKSAADNFKQMGSRYLPTGTDAVDPNTGLPQDMINQSNMQGLRNMSALFLAAGQSQSGADRAKILAQMGDATDQSKSIYNLSQSRLMNSRVQDSLDERDRRTKALAALRGADVTEFSDLQRQAYNSYLEAGDPEGAAAFLGRVADNNSSLVQAPNGVMTSKGMLNSQMQSWTKNYQPDVKAWTDAAPIYSDVLDILDAGMLAGTTGDWQLAAEKLKAATGKEIDPRALNRETFIALTKPLILQNMKLLGGNDTEKELAEVSKSYGGGNLELPAIRNVIGSAAKTAIQRAAVGTQVYNRIGTNEFGNVGAFSEDMVPETVRPIWNRVVAGEKEDKSGYATRGSLADKSGKKDGAAAPAAPATSYKKYW